MFNGIREQLRTRPAVGTIAAVATLLAAVGIGSYFMSSSQAVGPTFPSKSFFTTDDGATFFIDDSALVAPFDRGGKTAYQAAVFQCPEGKRFVGYLMKFSASGKTALEAIPKAQRQSASPEVMAVRSRSLSVKKRRGSEWVPIDGEHPVKDIIRPLCPDGSDHAEQVTP